MTSSRPAHGTAMERADLIAALRNAVLVGVGEELILSVNAAWRRMRVRH